MRGALVVGAILLTVVLAGCGEPRPDGQGAVILAGELPVRAVCGEPEDEVTSHGLEVRCAIPPESAGDLRLFMRVQDKVEVKQFIWEGTDLAIVLLRPDGTGEDWLQRTTVVVREGAADYGSTTYSLGQDLLAQQEGVHTVRILNFGETPADVELTLLGPGRYQVVDGDFAAPAPPAVEPGEAVACGEPEDAITTDHSASQAGGKILCRVPALGEAALRLRMEAGEDVSYNWASESDVRLMFAQVGADGRPRSGEPDWRHYDAGYWMSEEAGVWTLRWENPQSIDHEVGIVILGAFQIMA